MDSAEVEAQRSRLRAELEAARGEFHAMVASISEREWTLSSRNTAWTNGQVVFHILLGFILVLPLARLLVFFDRLPDQCSRTFAKTLDLSTPLFHRVNAIGPRVGARLLGRAGIISRFDHVHRAILARLDRARPVDWEATMHYPTRWDPRFHARMDLAALLRYPIGHLRHHRDQLRTAAMR
jgi:hypothetical protein